MTMVSTKAFRSAVVIAPYSPIGRGEMVHLGAARKIEFVLEMLSELSESVALINTAHNNSGRLLKSVKSTLRISNNAEIEEYLPFQLPVRPMGKLLNLVLSNGALSYLESKSPDLIWLYNGHALECKLALAALVKHKSKVVMEVEDSHNARSRGISPKPYIDQSYFNRAMAKFDLMTFVNEAISKQFDDLECAKLSFPGSVATDLLNIVRRLPFSGAGSYVAGYFGGLEKEKGADVLLDSIRRLEDANWKFVVCGRGKLQSAFEDLAAETPNKLSVFRDLGSAELYQLMDGVDVMINPHSDIQSMSDGIFPFKIMEAIAAGRPIISTRLPASDPDVSEAVMLFDGTSDQLIEQLCAVRAFWDESHSKVAEISADVRKRYSSVGFGGQLLNKLLN